MKRKALVTIRLLMFFVSTQSCKGQQDAICRNSLNMAAKIAYTINAASDLNLDSALLLSRYSMQCDATKQRAAELIVRIMITKGQYDAGVAFVDSLNETHFIYAYKKEVILNNFLALKYKSISDSLKEVRTYQHMASYLNQYIESKNNLTDQEFKEAYIDLFIIKGHYMSTNTLVQELDLLIKRYPSKVAFFDSLKP